MALNPKLAVARRNAALDNILGANTNSGLLRIYDGTQATDADTALGAQVLLAQLTMNATSFPAASSGVATANAITSDSAADATGTATWFRLRNSGDTITIMDGSVGTATSNLVLNSTAIQINATVACSSFVITFPA